MEEALDRREVRRIARLARLALSEEEAERLARELASVLAHFEAIDAARAEGDPAEELPDRDPAPRLADDAPAADPLLRGPEALAPEWRDGFFLVPRPPALDEPGP